MGSENETDKYIEILGNSKGHKKKGTLGDRHIVLQKSKEKDPTK